ncbi:PHP domain-containing protein [Demequina sp. SYSU T00039]|uniref:PHP domain-containing protein n=1 Tax=Demequina lignilytica TaxID=3051663 RepID=A0AAW7M3W4_9MICO|nr:MULTISPECIES: PHP domain-containing protein [unclassified Demequina]MDN4478228.1 PHP domain-containing protein [Demequina sp. SYSU T00039-1]MDN4488322.1 PHP domain-containing protein [Demequina sp. SYSU T00039]
MRIDLHTHSTVSDGTGTPEQVMHEAYEARLDIVALTDHDSIDGWGEASEVASGLGLGFVPGIEISAKDRWVSIHMLALWPRPFDEDLVAMLARTRAARLTRAREMVGLIAADYPITWDDVMEFSGDAATVGRPHIADALVARGCFPSRDAVFADVLHNGSAYYVPHYAPDVHDAVRVIRAAGGVPVFAHPAAHARGKVVPDRVIRSLAAAGLAGLEIDHRDHDDASRTRLHDLAAKHGLVPTGSSDYHGDGKLNRLGENLTSPEAYEALRAQRG